MRRLWRFFSRMDLGFWLLVCASLNLFIGLMVTIWNEALFNELNFMPLAAWLQPMWTRPWLYAWIFTLFVLLLLLAVNTVACTVSYAAAALRRGLLLKKLGIVLFHLAFVLALGGHCLSVLTVSSERLVLEAGTSTRVEGAGLAIEALDIRKISPADDGSRPPLGIEARLRAVPLAGEALEMDIRTMRPQFIPGYTLHLSFMDKGLSGGQARLIVRRDYGLALIALAGLTACAALALYLIFSLPGRPETGSGPS